MYGQQQGRWRAAICIEWRRTALRAVSVSPFILATSLAATGLHAQTIWNGYQGSNSVEVRFQSDASTSSPPQINLGVGTATVTNFTFDTGSTGIQIPVTAFCTNNNPNCTGNGGTVITTGNTKFLGYAQITLTSSGVQNSGAVVLTTVAINDKNGNQIATAQVPVLVGDSNTPFQGGVGFGRPETQNGLQLYTDSSLQTKVTGPNSKVYGRALNPLLNLTQLNTGSGLSNIPSSIAPGYVVTQQGVYLGLGSSSIQNGTQQLNGPSISLTALQQPASGRVRHSQQIRHMRRRPRSSIGRRRRC